MEITTGAGNGIRSGVSYCGELEDDAPALRHRTGCSGRAGGDAGPGALPLRLVVRAFTNLYPDEVVGMVLVDASHPDQWAHIPASRDGKFNGNANLVTAFLARLGVVRFFHLESASYAGLPERQATEMEAILAKPESWRNSGQVLLIWNDRSRPQINQARSLDDLPLAVLSVTEQPIYGDVLTSLQNDLPTLSSNSVHYTEVGATHETLVSERKHALVVARTIQSVLEAARTGRFLSEVFSAGQ